MQKQQHQTYLPTTNKHSSATKLHLKSHSNFGCTSSTTMCVDVEDMFLLDLAEPVDDCYSPTTATNTASQDISNHSSTPNSSTSRAASAAVAMSSSSSSSSSSVRPYTAAPLTKAKRSVHQLTMTTESKSSPTSSIAVPASPTSVDRSRIVDNVVAAVMNNNSSSSSSKPSIGRPPLLSSVFKSNLNDNKEEDSDDEFHDDDDDYDVQHNFRLQTTRVIEDDEDESEESEEEDDDDDVDDFATSSDEDSLSEEEYLAITNNPSKILENIQALARSVHNDTEVFGSLPRRHFNTGELVTSLSLV